MAYKRDSLIKRPIAGVLWASLAGGLILLILVGQIPCEAEAGEGCGKFQLLVQGPYAIVLLPLSYACSFAVSVLFLVPIAYGLETYSKLTFFRLTAAMLVASLLAALVLKQTSISAAQFFAIWFAAISSCYWVVATRDT